MGHIKENNRKAADESTFTQLMNNEQVIFLKLISDYMHSKETTPPDDINWATILRYASEQELEGLVFYQCRHYLEKLKKGPESQNLRNTYDSLNQAYSKTVFHYVRMTAAFQELKKAFQNNGIPFFTVKGLLVGARYPVPALRTMGDLDIITTSEDRHRAGRVLESLGYDVETGIMEWRARRDIVLIELHDRLHYAETGYLAELFNSFFSNCDQKEEYFYKLKEEYHFVFLIDHLRKHFDSHGVGFRQFMDIAVFAQKTRNLDWVWIQAELEELGLMKFTKTVFAMIREWWDVEMPASIIPAELDQAFIEQSTDLIFKNGVFGFENEEHWKFALRGSVRSIHAPALLKPVVRGIREVCKPYDVMIKYPYCSFAVNRKYLLPAAWGRRLIYLLKNKKKESIKAIRSMYDMKHVEEHMNFKRQWGR